MSTGGTPKGTPDAVEVRPETVVVMPGTRRMLARNFIVVHVGRRDEPTFDVVLLVGIDGHVAAFACGRFETKAEAVQAAREFGRGERELPRGAEIAVRADAAPDDAEPASYTDEAAA